MPPTRYKGSEIYLGIALHGETEVNFAGAFRGLSSVEVNDAFDTREIPGGGAAVGTQLLEYIEAAMSFEIDDNSITHPVLFGNNARRFDATFGPEGGATGNPSQAFEGIATITHSCNARGIRRHSVSFDIDGEITEGTF